MKEPKPIPLTNNPRCKEPEKIPLNTNYPQHMEDDVYIKTHENILENNTKSIQSLEAESSD